MDLDGENGASEAAAEADYFVTEGGETFAGKNLLIEFWDAQNLNQPDLIDAALRELDVSFPNLDVRLRNKFSDLKDICVCECQQHSESVGF